MRFAAFVINVQSNQSRAAHAAALIEQLPLPAEILPAVNGSLLRCEEIDAVYRPNLLKPNYPFALSAGEVGCFLSHRKSWNEIVTRDLDAGFVLEDDVYFQDLCALEAALDFAESHCPPGAYLQFPVRQLPKDSQRIVSGDACRIVCPRITPLRASGQWITREAAKTLLSHTEQFDRPVDTLLQMYWLTGIRLLAIEPSGMTDMTSGVGGSVINADKQRSWQPSRDFHRAVYRWRVSSHSKTEHAYSS